MTETQPSSALPISDAPPMPLDAIQILLDGNDKVFDKDEFRWRYTRDGVLLRVMEYRIPRSIGMGPIRYWGM